MYDDTAITVDSLIEKSTEDASKIILQNMQYGDFSEFISVNEDDLFNRLGLMIDDGNFYNPLNRGFDKDGITDKKESTLDAITKFKDTISNDSKIEEKSQRSWL